MPCVSTGVGSPASIERIQICEGPDLVDRNASRLLSGDQRGRSSDFGLRVIWRASPPLAGTSQRSLFLLFFSTS